MAGRRRAEDGEEADRGIRRARPGPRPAAGRDEVEDGAVRRLDVEREAARGVGLALRQQRRLARRAREEPHLGAGDGLVTALNLTAQGEAGRLNPCRKHEDGEQTEGELDRSERFHGVFLSWFDEKRQAGSGARNKPRCLPGEWDEPRSYRTWARKAQPALNLQCSFRSGRNCRWQWRSEGGVS